MPLAGGGSGARIKGGFDRAHGRGTHDAATAMHQTIITVGNSLRTQAAMTGYADCFGLLGAVLVVATMIVLLLKKGRSAADAAH